MIEVRSKNQHVFYEIESQWNVQEELMKSKAYGTLCVHGMVNEEKEKFIVPQGETKNTYKYASNFSCPSGGIEKFVSSRRKIVSHTHTSISSRDT